MKFMSFKRAEDSFAASDSGRVGLLCCEALDRGEEGTYAKLSQHYLPIA
jgi:hypothetical protein